MSAAPTFLNTAMNGLHTAWEKTKAVGEASKSLAIGTKNYLIQDIWQKQIKSEAAWEKRLGPLYTYRIKPLFNRKDALTIGGCAATAIVVDTIAISTLGAGILPLTLGGGLLLVFGGYCIADHRLTCQYNEQAWDKLDQMRRKAFKISFEKKNVGVLSNFIQELKKPPFEYLKEDVDQLERKTEEFIRNIRYDYEPSLKATTSFIEQIITVKPSDTLAQLKTEISKAGRRNYNPGKIETLVGQLNGHLDFNQFSRLCNHVDKLNDALRYPSYKEAKKAYLNHIKGFQEKLCYYRTVEALGDSQLELEPQDSQLEFEQTDDLLRIEADE